jgi:hypothetical protein
MPFSRTSRGIDWRHDHPSRSAEEVETAVEEVLRCVHGGRISGRAGCIAGKRNRADRSAKRITGRQIATTTNARVLESKLKERVHVLSQ